MRDVCELAKKIKLIVCDVDGTLLNSQHRLSARTVEAAKRAKERGIPLTIASGRSVCMLADLIAKLGITGPLVTINGAQIVNAADRRVISELDIPFEKIEPYLALCAENGIDYVAMSDKMSAFGRSDGRYKIFVNLCEQYKKLKLPCTEPIIVEKDFSNIRSQKICKVVAELHKPHEKKLLTDFIETQSDFQYTMSSDVLFEVFDRRVDKGVGVRAMAEYLGLTPDEVCVFGDFDNDLPMFSACGLPIAMGNAYDGIKAQAAYVTASNDEDGVALAIEKLFLQ